MASTKRRALIATLSLLGLFAGGMVGFRVYQASRYLRCADAVRVPAEPGQATFWSTESTGQGWLLRPKSGKFRGWHLSVDPVPGPSAIRVQSKQRGRTVWNSYALPVRRRLVLTENPIPSSYWKLDEADGVVRLVQSQGDFERWGITAHRMLGPNGDYLNGPDWKLDLSEPDRRAASWILTETKNGRRIRLKNSKGEFYLDFGFEAEIETLDLWTVPEAPPEPVEQMIELNQRTSLPVFHTVHYDQLAENKY
ncbi:MAG: hypothetical protein AAF517_03570 [Planctomycetota bacterium]